MRILIINQPPFNRGDESAHKGLLRSLLNKLPECSIKVLYDPVIIESMRQYSINDERVAYIQYPNRMFHFGRFSWYGTHKGFTLPWYFHPTFLEYKNIYKWADVVVCAPGGICMGGFQNWDHIFHLMLAKFYKKNLAYFGRSFGPFATETEDNKCFKKLSLEMLDYMSFISIRDAKTQKLADNLGFKYLKTVDSAFLDSPSVQIPWEIRQSIGNSPYMVFVPNYLLWHFAYKGRISHQTVFDFYNKIIEEIWYQYPELKIVLLPQTFCESDYCIDDVQFFRDLAESRKDERIIVCANCYGSDVQQTLIHNAKFLIGARYHSIVFSINQNVPFIALSYEHKISGLLQSLNKSDRCIDITKSLDSVVNQNITITQVKNLLVHLSKDDEAHNRAKQIVSDCMDNFIKFIKTIEA